MITVNLDVMMAKRKMSLNTLSEKVGITLANLSILKNNKAKAIRFSTLDAICKALDCDVSDIIAYEKEPSAPAGPIHTKSTKRSTWDYGTIIDPTNEF